MSVRKSGVTSDAVRQLEGRGFKARTVSVAHIPELQERIDSLIREGLLSRPLQETYLRFKYNPEEALKGAKTVFVVAMPSPLTRATFSKKGKTYTGDIPPTYIVKNEENVLKDTLAEVLKPAGYGFARARLPLKTLSVCSGLAQYGRNNVTYVPGFGSFHRLAAFYSDAPCDTDSWREPAVMKVCEKCTACMDNCPTQAIAPDRFLVHTDRCLTWFNEREDVYPDWLLPHWHNALIGCMLCQQVCPVDRPHFKKVAEGPAFTEEESELILRGTPQDELPETTRAKLPDLGYESPDMYVLLARNLRVLIEKEDK